ncbi:MAG: phosphatidylserine decarboxylase [Gammaproteobacteria bacterium]|nr:phosphatidylserine decarboxylase [Gammaproteobacteria bacterium]
MNWDFIKSSPQYLLPQHLLSAWMYRAARWHWTPFKNTLIRLFVRHYRVDMSIAEKRETGSYHSFNEFFTRALQPSSRPVDQTQGGVVSPVDGSVSQFGMIVDDHLVQAKGKLFSLDALLANDRATIRSFSAGSFATIYLSPRDYHRIHLPVDATLRKMTYVPGDLFSVNESTSKSVDQLFARNERVICLFDTEFGSMACILVGAIFVGGMETVWHGEISPSLNREIQNWVYEDPGSIKLNYEKGEELGRFNMGSTVILLFEKNKICWDEVVSKNKKLEMGQLIAAAIDGHV